MSNEYSQTYRAVGRRPGVKWSGKLPASWANTETATPPKKKSVSSQNMLAQDQAMRELASEMGITLEKFIALKELSEETGLTIRQLLDRDRQSVRQVGYSNSYLPGGSMWNSIAQQQAMQELAQELGMPVSQVAAQLSARQASSSGSQQVVSSDSSSNTSSQPTPVDWSINGQTSWGEAFRNARVGAPVNDGYDFRRDQGLNAGQEVVDQTIQEANRTGQISSQTRDRLFTVRDLGNTALSNLQKDFDQFFSQP